MKLLLDTHVLLWWLNNNKPLSEEAYEVICESTNFVFISAATAWEISIKKSLGKLEAPDDLEEALPLDGGVLLVHPVSEPTALLVAGVVDELGEDDRPSRRQRSPRPPQVQRARVRAGSTSPAPTPR